MLPLISLIIPAYNASSRIKFTLESIINQDYENLEIILVNDASCDDTALIANKVLGGSHIPSQIINHEINRGECASRNTGLEASKGEYVCFVDADDMIAKNFVSDLYEAITRDNCEIVFCGRVDRFINAGRESDKKIHSAKDRPYVDSGSGFILNHSVPPVWCCMYNLSFLKKYNLLFHEGCNVGGDVEFITKAFCKAEKVTFTAKHLYIYIHHDDMGSIRDNNTRDKQISRYEHNTYAQERTGYYLLKNSHDGKIKSLAENILIPQVIIRKCNLFSMKNDREGYKTFIHDSESRKILRRTQSLSVLVHKPEVFLKAFMILNMPGLYYMMRKR